MCIRRFVACVVALAATASVARADVDTTNNQEIVDVASDAETSPVATSASDKVIEPFATIVGGVRYESLQRREGDNQQERSPTVAVSRVGARGRIGKYVSFETEFEANVGGGMGYGASVWEGQAQMSVRNQFVKYERAGVSVAAGRITDYASIDFFSAHVADLLLTDVYTRDSLLYSGADRGTGVRTTYRIGDSVTTGLTFHSTNPTGLTGTFLIGGELFPYDRPFFLAAAQVGRSASTLPDQNLHIYFGTPSVLFEDDRVEAKAAMQLYMLDTQVSTDSDQSIRGYNLRGNVKLKLLDDRVMPFVNVSRNQNEMLDPGDATVKLEDIYTVVTFGGGLDFNYQDSNGIGVQYQQVRQDSNTGNVTDHYINVGTTYWVQQGLSLGLRLGWFVRDDSAQEYTYGHSSVFGTARLVL